VSKKLAKTPLRRMLRERSPLQASVRDGMDAVEKSHRDYFDPSIRPTFADSLELDEALRAGREQENRWDYLLGHSPSGEAIAIEPHSAKQDQVTTVIRKRRAALAQLAEHLRDGARISRWLWVASGKVQFAKTEKAKLMLDQNGIEFVGTKVLAKHLPVAEPTGSTDRTSTRRKRGR
jgi:hypothetical protein